MYKCTSYKCTSVQVVKLQAQMYKLQVNSDSTGSNECTSYDLAIIQFTEWARPLFFASRRLRFGPDSVFQIRITGIPEKNLRYPRLGFS